MDVKGGRRWVGIESEREVTLVNRLKMHGCQAFREGLVIKLLDVDLQEVRD